MESISILRSNRVVGEPDKDFKIYIEDYVKSYMARLTQDISDKGRIEILYGRYRTDGTKMEIDINGAAALTDISRTGTGDGRLLREIEVLNNEFFPELEPVGWFYNPVRGRIDYAAMMDVHEELLGEHSGVMILPNPDSPDPDVYSYSQDGFRKHRGYVVYYEKNTEMQEYLLAHTGGNRVNGESKEAKANKWDESREEFKQRIVRIPAKVKQLGSEVLKKRSRNGISQSAGGVKSDKNLPEYFFNEAGTETAGGLSDEAAGGGVGEAAKEYIPLSVCLLFTGLIAVVFAGLLISFKTYYYTNFNDAIAYIKEFLKYYLK